MEAEQAAVAKFLGKTMTTQVTATFTNGVLKPDHALPLAEQARVRLTIEPIENWSASAAIAAWESLKQEIHQHPLHFGGQRYSRDELHERH
jgi:hypothetical protein